MSATAYATTEHNRLGAGPTTFNLSAVKRQPAAPDGDQLHLQRRFDSILKGVKSPTAAEMARHVFDRLARLRGVLRIIEVNVGEDGPLPVTLAAFSLVDSESRALVRFIEARLSKLKSIKGPLREALDGMGFALGHELKEVFGHSLAGITPGRRPGEVRADVLRAHGLLTNCFEQSLIALARVFDPSVTGELLFDNYRAKLEQSSLLLRDLTSLQRLALRAGEGRDEEAGGLLALELRAFRQGAMHYLMYKDWEEFGDIAGEVASSRGSARHGFILHCFATYLEALINQVRMRAVLNDQPPEQKPFKRSRRGGAATAASHYGDMSV